MADAAQVAQMLRQHSIQATYQRIEVLRELMSRRDHPGAEAIHEALKSSHPPISKATVYNVLKLFSQKGILKPLYIDLDSLRYDVDQEIHGHFHCDQCKRIFNIEAPPALNDAPLPPGFQVTQRDLYMRGICKDCTALQQDQPEAVKIGS